MKLKDKTWYPIIYMFIITLFFTAILILFGNFTQERVENNKQIDFERAILEALPFDLPKNASPVQIHHFYVENISEPDASSAGAYRYIVNDSLVAYALPIAGPGFWAPVEGVIGITADRVTVTGISFYKQEETPGLGGEIVNPVFRDQFVGKKLVPGPTAIEFRMPTEPLDENSVHTITGATQTSKRISTFINAQLAAWQKTMAGEQ